MSRIFLVSTDGTWDGVIKGEYAKDEEEIKEIVQKHRESHYLEEVKKITVALGRVYFSSRPVRKLSEEWGTEEYYLISLHPAIPKKPRGLFKRIGGWLNDKSVSKPSIF